MFTGNSGIIGLREKPYGIGMAEKLHTISTHTPLARRDRAFLRFLENNMISTQTPLARRDTSQQPPQPSPCISTHTPLARRDGGAVGCGFFAV